MCLLVGYICGWLVFHLSTSLLLHLTMVQPFHFLLSHQLQFFSPILPGLDHRDAYVTQAGQSEYYTLSHGNRFRTGQSRPSLGFLCWSLWEELPPAFGVVELKADACGHLLWPHAA